MTSDEPQQPVGLRERSKARRRNLIKVTALRLFAERGYDQTTIIDIADAAEVAPRTVTGYFPSKLDFVTDHPAALTDLLIKVSAQNPGSDLVTLIDLWWRELRATTDDQEEAQLSLAMARTNPGVMAMAEAEVTKRVADSGLSLAGHTGRAADDPVQLAARTAISGVNVAFFRARAEGKLTDDLHAALLDMVRAIADAAKIAKPKPVRARRARS